jgi:membrane protease YdiL (CAAX protease family)
VILRVRDLILDITARLAVQADGEATSFRASHSSWEINRRAAIVLVGAALCLLGLRFLGGENDVSRLTSIMSAVGLDDAARALRRAFTSAPDAKLNVRIFWCASRICFYGVVPLLVVRFVLRERLRDYGLSTEGFFKHAPLYLGLIAVVLPLVFWASSSAAFQAKYPYYRFGKDEPLMPNLLYWECLYGAQFVALEVFFRGFLIHGLRPILGYASIFVSIVPYVMIHFGKPLPEALGSCVTGFVLGALSMRTRSIWGGAMAHVTIASSMDLCALWHRGLL